VNNLVKFGLLTLIFKYFKIFISIAGGTVLLISWWLFGQLPEEPKPIEEVITEIDSNQITDNVITECKDKLYLIAINYDLDDESTEQLKEDFAEAHNDFIRYYFSDQIQKKEDAKRTSLYRYYLRLTEWQPPGPNSNFAKIIDEFGFVADEYSKDRIDGTNENLNTIQKMYVALKYYPDDPGIDYAKLFCSFLK